MKTFLKTFLITGIGYGLLMGIYFGFIQANISVGILNGIFLGITFGLMMAIFQAFQSKKFKKMGATIPNLIFSSSANHLSAGGWLFLTATQLIFKSHKINLNSHELIIELKDIVSVESVLTLGIVPNGLLISTMTNKERFVVDGRKNWVDKIMKAKVNL